jgi:hypothetical protein
MAPFIHVTKGGMALYTMRLTGSLQTGMKAEAGRMVFPLMEAMALLLTWIFNCYGFINWQHSWKIVWV